MACGYRLEFILHAKGASLKSLHNSLAEFGTELSVCECRDNAQPCDYAITMATQEPELVFDLCSQFGRIRKVKVSELK